MSLSRDYLHHDSRYAEAHRKGDRRGDPMASGFRPRLSVEPKRADRIMLWLAVGAVVVTIILSLTGAMR